MRWVGRSPPIKEPSVCDKPLAPGGGSYLTPIRKSLCLARKRNILPKGCVGHTPHDTNKAPACGGVRVCPIFPKLRAYLERAWANTPDGAGSEFVINRYRRPDQNLRETFLKILKRAGVTPWPRLFQNLRATRETELMARYPSKDVASWLGNSEPVAIRHYAMATEGSFLAAANPDGQTVTRKPDHDRTENGGCISGLYGAIEPETRKRTNPCFDWRNRGFYSSG